MIKNIKLHWEATKTKAVQLRRNKKLILYLFFIVIATLFWFLHSLGKEYVANINIDVSYINFPKDKEPTNKTIRRHTLNVKADGFSLLRMQSNSLFSDYIIDVSRLKQKPSSVKELVNYSLSTSAIQNQFEGQIGEGITVNSIFPEDVNFEVKNLLIKKVPILSDIKVKVRSGYMRSQKPTIAPDSIIVRGDYDQIDTLEAIYTQHIVEEDVFSSFSLQVPLQIPTGVEAQKESATISYKIDEYIEEERTIHIIPLNFPDSVTVKLQPNEVKLSYRTYAEAKKNLKDDDFILIVDYYTLNDFSEKVEVQAINLPSGISRVYMTPRYVNYIITQKK